MMASNTFPMIAPDGSVGDVPLAGVPDAVKSNFKVGVEMTSPDGRPGVIPFDRVHEAIAGGFNMAGKAPALPAPPAELQPYSEMNPTETYPNPNAGHFGFPLNDEQSRAVAMDTNIPVGAAKGAASTVNNALRAAQWIHNKTTPGPDVNLVPDNPELLKPADNEKLGYGAEQAGEFLAPGGLTSKLGEAATVAKDAPLLARVGSALTRGAIEGTATGGVEALHGGDAGDVAMAAGAGAGGSLATDALQSAVQSLSDRLYPAGADPTSGLFKGIKPSKITKTQFAANVDRAVPEVLNAEKQTGTQVTDAQTLLDNIKQAKKNVYAKVDGLMQQADSQGAVVNGDTAAAAAQTAVDGFNAPVSKGQTNAIEKLKDFYSGPATLSQTEDRLQTLNAQLESFYNSSGVGQAKSLKVDPVTAAKAAIAQDLRSQVDDALTNVTGQGSSELKKTYGSLRQLEDATMRRIPVAERASPYGMPEQVGMPGGVFHVAKGVMTGNLPEAAAGAGRMLLSSHMQNMNSANSLIEQAFKTLRAGGPTAPVNLGGLAGRSLAGTLSTLKGSYDSQHDMDGIK